MSERTYDVVVFGATGFTGGLCAEYLADHAPAGARWAIAGRSVTKLQAILRKLESRKCPPKDAIAADAGDDASLHRLASQARVILSTVGPFDDYGEPLVRACVDQGAHYVDITGEPRFVDRMIDLYHDEARKKNLRIVSCCGFDSIPTDLGVLFTLEQLPHGAPAKIEGFVRTRGHFSGGTWHSAIRAMGKLREYVRERRARPKPTATGGRKVKGMKARVRYERELGAWVCPLPTIDPQIVFRSARLMDEYGPDFRYGHYAQIKNASTLVGGVAFVGGLVALAQVPPARKLLLKLKDPGEGPSEEERARGWFKLTFFGKSGDRTVRTEVRGGEPGYAETSKMVSESALCLAFDELPPHTGVITPAAAMGRVLIDRLQRAGIGFDVVRA
jgi:short subunit dehydrogenase-like uncharacterized protein